MKRILSAALATFCLSLGSHAQTTPAPPATDPQMQRQSPPSQPAQRQTQAAATGPRIAPGSVIPVQLTKTVDAKKIKSGDEVQAQVTQDLKTNSGEVIVPKGTKFLGHVTSAQPHSKEEKESELGIAFDHAVLKNGTEMNLPLSIQAVIAPPSANPGNAGNEQSPAPSSQAGGIQPGGGGRSPGMAGNQGSSQAPPTPSASGEASETQASSSPAAITANTKGVVGIPNLTLTAASPNSGQGSVLSSEKNNVKLESGTMLLLRVNQ
jgi:hypothetical protein